MREKSATPDSIIARIAARQHGAVAVAQLFAAGLDKSAITRRVAAGRLHRIHRGVYAVGNPKITREGGWMAAVLACGKEAVLSHHSAAALWQLSPTCPPLAHVTLPGASGRRSRRRIVLHRSRTLTRADTTRRRGIPTTTLAAGPSNQTERAQPPRLHRPSLHRPGAVYAPRCRGRLPTSPPPHNAIHPSQFALMFTDAFPIISTPDIERALGFYRDLLGGTVDYRFPAEGEPGYVSLRIGEAHLGIGNVPEAESGAGGQRFSLWVYAESCDEAVERLRAGGATVTEEPADQPWGERVARVLDPEGNEVIVGQRA